jgi:hypothetical protein
MNGIDEFIELSLGLFALVTGLIVLLTYLERTLDRKADDSAQPVNDRPGTTAAIQRWWRRRRSKS